VIAGSGPEDAALRQLATQLRIEQRVIFLGFVTHLQRWMQAADGFVLSSLWEGLPMTLIEAAACALPAVATRVAGSSEVIAENETGFLCQPASAAALREAMGRLMRLNAGEQRAMGEQARLRALQCFSIDAVLDRWEELYLDLLKRKPQPSRWGLE
jgi:glycosyltransferase involved in cell wall biosynthesis